VMRKDAPIRQMLAMPNKKLQGLPNKC